MHPLLKLQRWSRSNTPPTLAAQTNRTISELTLLTVINTANDTDLPATALDAYAAFFNPPPELRRLHNGAVITWTPTEAQGLSTNTHYYDDAITAPALERNYRFVVVVTVKIMPSLLICVTNRDYFELAVDRD